jgi:hypothetical protein
MGKNCFHGSPGERLGDELGLHNLEGTTGHPAA